ncbi:MAG: hypothetical protein IKF78_09990 [Atopobiaceae bacterium]|nr:hypothetical protein [Atopobiaceae bacterium]
MSTQETRRAGMFGDRQHDGHIQKPPPANCVAAETTHILPEELDNTLQTTTAEKALPAVALELHPELRGTSWHRVAWSTASTLLARALLGADEQVTALARWIARMLMASGDVTAFGSKVLVLGDGVAVAFGDRSLYVRRTDG